MKFLAQATEAGRALRGDVRVIFAQFGRQDILFHAGSVAYSALLAGVPFALLLASAIGYILGAKPAASNETLLRFLSQLLPEQSAVAALPIVQGVLADVQTSRGTTGLVGAVLFAWFSTQFFGALGASLGSVFAVERGRGIIRGKLFDFVSVVVGTLLVTLYIGLDVAFGSRFGPALVRTLTVDPTTYGMFEFVVGRVVALTFLAMMFTALYKFLPNRHVRWGSAIWGGVWGATLFEIARNVIFALVTRVMNPASLYSGTLAAIVVVLFWAYYAAVIFLIGGVVARMHEMQAMRNGMKAEPA